MQNKPLVPAEKAFSIVRSNKSLSAAERAFRSMKTVDLKVRPIHHRLEDRVRAHVFLCMLAYYIEWHMRESLAPLLFDEDDPEASEQRRSCVVAKARRSASTQNKAASKKTALGYTKAKAKVTAYPMSWQMVSTARRALHPRF